MDYQRRLGTDHGKGVKGTVEKMAFQRIPTAIGTDVTLATFRAAIPTDPAARRLLPNATIKSLPPSSKTK